MARVTDSTTTAVAMVAAGRADASDDGPDGDEPRHSGRKPGFWAAARVVWQRIQRAILGLPGWLRWVLFLAGTALAALAGTLLGAANAGSGVKVLFTQGPGPFWAYVQKQPVETFVLRFPVVFVVLAVAGLLLIALARIIHQQNQKREGVEIAALGYEVGRRREAGIAASELPEKLRVYLTSLRNRYDRLDLPAIQPLRRGGEPLHLSEVAIDLPLERRDRVGGIAARLGGVAAESTTAQGGLPLHGVAALLGLDDLAARVIPADSIDDIPSRKRRFILIGGPDSGKSTLLKRQAILAAQRYLEARHAGQRANTPLPLYLTAHDIVAAGTVKAAVQGMLTRLGAEERLTEHLMHEVRQGRAVVCVDDLDALNSADHATLAESLTQMEASDETTVVLASRAEERPDSPLFGADYRVWKIQNLAATPGTTGRHGGGSPSQQQLAGRLFAAFDHVLPGSRGQPEVNGAAGDGAAGDGNSAETEAQTFIKALTADPRSSDWSANPLLFSVAAAVYKVEGLLPRNRVEMYRRLLKETQRGPGDGDGIEQRLSRRVLADLALWLYRQDRRALTLDDLLTFLVEVEHESALGAVQLGKDLLRESVLEEAGSGRLRFRYDAFVEYLAAVALAQGLASTEGSRRARAIQELLRDYPLADWHDALVLVPSVLVQEYGRLGTEAAREWLRTLLDQAEAPAGDPAASGLELALESIEELGELPAVWQAGGIADDIGTAWVAELRRAAIYEQTARKHDLLALAGRLKHLGAPSGETAAGAGVGQAAALQVQVHFGDHDPHVRETMAQATLALSDQARVQEIVAILEDVRPGARTARLTAARVLWGLPAASAERQVALRTALSDEHWLVRLLALTGLAGEVSPAEVARARQDQSAAVRLVAEAYSALQGRVGPAGRVGVLLRSQWDRAGLEFADERMTLRTCAAAIGIECFLLLVERQFGDAEAAVRRSSDAVVSEARALAAPEQATTPVQRASSDDATAPNAQSAAAEAQDANSAQGAAGQARQAAIQALETLGLLNANILTSLRDAVGDSNAAIRAVAGAVLGLLALLEAIEPDQAGDPAASLRDESVVMRVVALIWLACVEDDPTETLRAHLDDPTSVAVRFTAVLLLGVFAADDDGDTAHSTLLKDLLVGKTHDPSPAVAIVASLMLAVAVPPISREALMRGLPAPLATTRMLTLCILGLLGTLGKLDGPVVARDVENALRGEKRWYVSLLAGTVTEWLRHQRQLAGETPLDLFAEPLNSPQPAVRMMAVAGLCVLGLVGNQDEHALTALLTRAVGDQSPAVVAAGLTALGTLEYFKYLTQPLAEGGLLPALGNANLLVRLVAIAALTLLADRGRIGTPPLAESLGHMAGQGADGRDSSALARTAATLALAALGSASSGRQQTRVLQQLTGALRDESWWVRISAAVGWVSAAQSAPPRQVAELLGSSQRIWVRFGTAVLLAAEHDPRELQRLLLRLSADRSKPSEELARSLRHLRRPGRRDPLHGALHDRSAHTRRQAAVALAVLDGMRVMLGESDEAVRDVAVLALGALSLVRLGAPRGERRQLGIEGLVRALARRFSTQEDTIRDLAKSARDLADWLRRNEQVKRFLQRVRQGEKLAPQDDRVVRLLRPDTHWLVASAAVLELGVFGWIDHLKPEHAQRIADALHDTRPHGQQGVRTTALLVLYVLPLLYGYELQRSEDDVTTVLRDVLAWLDTGRHKMWGYLRGLLPLRGLTETAHARPVWLRAAGALLLGTLAEITPAMRDQLAVPQRLALASNDQSAVVRWAAITALRRLGESADPALLRARLSDHSAYVRSAAVGALDARGQQEPAETFEAALRDPDWNWSVRVAAVAALRKRQGIAGLQRALRDPSPAVRAAAAAALVTEAQRAKGDPLLAAFGDMNSYLDMLGLRASDTGTAVSEAEVAVTVATALRELGQHAPSSWVAAALDRESTASTQAYLAVWWLGTSDKLFARLDEGLRSPSWRVRAVTAALLGTLNDPRAEAALRQCAQRDTHAMVRNIAAGMVARRSAVAPPLDRPDDPRPILLDVLYVLGQDLQAAITDAVRALAGNASAADLVRPSVSTNMLERLEALLTSNAMSGGIQARAAQALSTMQQAVSGPAVRRMLELRRELGGRSSLDGEETARLVALDDALRFALRPPVAQTNTGQGDLST
ncbi:MAG TPA: HEAT repeat domain-containing protein [Ktedonobacterales bacterium]